MGLWNELVAIDTAVYGAIAWTRTPTLDRAFQRISHAADHSKLWLACAAGLALSGGDAGRRAAVNGVASIAVTSAVVNAVLKPLARRRRPGRAAFRVPVTRRVRMPRSSSFPSGHAASAFAFANGAAIAAPEPGIALNALAAVVGYSRIHTGVHYPSDVLVGSVIGAAMAPMTVAALERHRAWRALDAQKLSANQPAAGGPSPGSPAGPPATDPHVEPRS
jgi:membrane-associated phospholipid phosphatase